MSQPTAPSRPLALQLPLQGSRLIEASAGTGKTYTISALYLRLVLGHGEAAAFGRALLPPQILVVTFTDAATRELRDRIRARLVEAARVFRGEEPGDDLLQQLRGDIDPADWPARARDLELAAQWMDEAAVSTIHSWCQRMLREHAFDSGSLFTQTLQTDHSELLAEVARDYWRQHCYALDGAALDWVIKQWQHPGSLLGQVRPLLGEGLAAPGEPLSERLGRNLAACEAALDRLKQPWRDWLPEVRTTYEQASAAGQFNGTKLSASSLAARLQMLDDWCNGTGELSFKGDYFKRFTQQGLKDACANGVTLADLSLSERVLAALNDMQTLESRLAALAGPGDSALQHAAGWIAARFETEKRRRAEMGFDDMLVRLDAALQGPNGERLAAVIREQFPVAMIDEFQDTDPLQYRIFDAIYRIERNAPDTTLLLIGDPKQAIYAFRGADIHTYLKARRATAGRHANLDTNFRSSHALVEAVNQVFLHAEQRPTGRGAFLFREPDDNPLPYLPVRAAGRKEVWQVEGSAQPALTFWHLPSEAALASGHYRTEMAARSASEIVRLLERGQRGQAGFQRADRFEPLAPGDIAVLVRDGGEARAIREALAQRGVRSVYLSDKDSVFASQEAHDLLLWLRACAEPDVDRRLRAALATRTLGLSLAQLDELSRDERRWERWVMQFRDYRQRWQRQGVLPMLHRLLHELKLPQQLMSRRDGERALTNLLHLAELLQQAATTLDGEQALIRHLGELLEGSGDAADEQVLRLESDAALVRVVTIHKSKGLEYPLVFLPFVCAFRPAEAGRPQQIHDGQQRRLVLQPDAEQLAQAEQERLAEDLRLLYVGLTRARHACWLGVADIKRGNGKSSQLHRSALGYLLGGGAALTDSAALPGWIDPLLLPAASVRCPAPAADPQRLCDVAAAPGAVQWRTPARKAAEHWWIASYSALRTDEAPAPLQRFEDAAPDSPAAQKIADDEREHVAMPLAASEVPSLHRFPRGPNPGTFLHGLLELAGREGFAACAADPARLREQIARRCQRRGLNVWIEPLGDWLQALIAQPLALDAGRAVALAELQHYQPELEFWFEARAVDVPQIDRLVCQHVLPGVARPALSRDTLNGMLKGFIDLVFEHDGRYYLIDYKSNWLGEGDAAYSAEAMQAAVMARRYDLQYVLYLLALHRQLRLRLLDYDYDTHIGGALYLFLRGSRGAAQGIHHARPPRALIEALDALFRGAQQPMPEAIA
ncbi:exodeoxyribonuclease V subunit beta [Pseudomonas sp. NW5]|uniref:exodeoxyribonuclease V subunit beta n=1 Tax=Pseudomonas sp. NW5 TaxID=2934934 RepID=UPI00202084D2|nr:exodeoxyribonuclease V subunit beta [Pseudomonas sp. NW5]MCL7461674.1 exodeoxyribonuclease V subunit beta [Pseudomonas sp. NW5]